MFEILKKRFKSIGFWKTLKLVFLRIYEALLQIDKVHVRRCCCCLKVSVFVKLGLNEDAVRCVRCGANNRYEILANYLRSHYSKSLKNMKVIEFDPSSPLRYLLSTSGSYTRSYFSPDDSVGTIRNDGSICQDLTRLTYENNSFDLMISSDVLEHIPDVKAVFEESARVLKVGGIHLFTVPQRAKTRPRAVVESGEIVHMLTPEYHLDPLNPNGILAFWDFGSDLGSVFSNETLGIVQYKDEFYPKLNIAWVAKKY